MQPNIYENPGDMSAFKSPAAFDRFMFQVAVLKYARSELEDIKELTKDIKDILYFLKSPSTLSEAQMTNAIMGKSLIHAIEKMVQLRELSNEFEVVPYIEENLLIQEVSCDYLMLEVNDRVRLVCNQYDTNGLLIANEFE